MDNLRCTIALFGVFDLDDVARAERKKKCCEGVELLGFLLQLNDEDIICYNCYWI